MSQGRKQVPLRLSAKLYEQLAAWAQDDFRSLNGQIEYLLTEAVKRQRGGQRAAALEEEGQDPDPDPA